MRKIDESLIPSGDSAYFKQGTWTHLQKAYIECLDAMVKSLVGKDYDTAKYYILHGCVATGTDPSARTISAGAIFHDGEIYLVPSASFTTTGAQVAVGTITTAYNTSDYSVDPQTTPNGNVISIHAIRTIVFTGGASGSGDVNYSALVQDSYGHNYKDIASQVTVSGGLSATVLDAREYADGTISIYLNATYAGTISANTLLLTVPSAQPVNMRAPALITNEIPAYSNIELFLTGGVFLQTIPSISGTYDRIFIYLNYKKA